MSTTVDSRVVEMRFDNKHFESNVSNTMSTLDKLKRALHLDGASKGLENISSSAKKVDLSGLSNGVETVQAKFSALQVVGVTALANITNSAVNAGKKIVSALTIDPVRSGFQEYEMKMDSIKTIVNSTGRDLKDVNKLLEELNEYSDQTIYSFKDMTQNIGKFTNAGVNLEDAVLAIKGISNEAAVSGASAQEASRAMYNFSQALSAGYVKLIDWKSIENANMATKEFKQQLIDTAVELGVVTQSGDMYTTSTGKSFNATKNFNDVLQEQWMTTDVLIKTLGKYADENTEIGKKAFAAAQEVTKFTQMWDVLKETAQSGWAKTWEIIVGDMNQAKAIFTPLTNFFGDIIDAMSDFRNAILNNALTRNFKSLGDKIQGVLKPAKDAMKTVKDLEEIVNRVIRGDFGNQGDHGDAQYRNKKLTEAGWEYAVVQNAVNEKLGYSLRLKTKGEQLDKEATATQEKLNETEAKRLADLIKLTDAELKELGYTKEQIKAFRDLENVSKKLGIPVEEFIEKIDEIDGRWLLLEGFKNIGKSLVTVFTQMGDAWAKIFPETSAKSLGDVLFDLIAGFHKFSRSLLVNKEDADKWRRTFEGIFAVLDIVLTIVGGPLKIAFKIFTSILGLFNLNVLDVTAVVGDVLVAFRDWIDKILDFNSVIEMMKAPFNDMVEAFSEWIESLKESENLPQDIAKGIADGFSTAYKAVKDFFKNLPQMFADGFATLGESPLAGFLAGLGNGFAVAGQTIVELGKMILNKINEFLSARGMKTISTYAIAGLVEGFKDGASKAWNAAVEMVTELVKRVRDFLEIDSPSKVFIAIGGFIIAGLVSGLKNSSPEAFGAFQGVLQPIIDWLKAIDFGAILAGIIGIGTVSGVYKFTSGIGNMLDGLGEIFVGTGEILQKSARPIAKVVKQSAKVVKNFSKVMLSVRNVLNAVAFDIKMGAVREFIESITKCFLMIAAAVVILTQFDKGDLWNAVGILAVLAVLLVGMAFAMSKLNSASATVDKGGINIKGLSSGLTGIGMAIMMLGITAKMLGTMKPEQLEQGMWSLVGIITAVGVLLIAFMRIPFGPSDAVIVTNLGKTMKQIGIALVLMAVVVKLLGGLDPTKLDQGITAIAQFAAIIAALMFATKLISGSKHVDTIGGTLLKIAAAIGLMALTAKMLGKMDPAELDQGITGISMFAAVIAALMFATKLINGSKNVDKIGGTLLKIAAAIGLMALTAKLLGNMKPGEMWQGIAAIAIFGGMIVGLIAATKLIGKNAHKVGGAILAVSGAIAIMAFTALMLSMISWDGFAKGTIMITAFAGIIVGLIAATKLVGKNADKIGKTIISIAGAIGILALIAVLLGLVPVDKLIQGGIAIGVLSIIIAGLIAVTSLVKKDVMATLLALAGVIAVLGGILITLSCLDPISVITSTIALGALLVVLGSVMELLIPIGKKQKTAMKGVLALLALSGVIVVLGSVLGKMRDVENAIPNAVALGILCLALTPVLYALSVIGKFAKDAALGALALAALAVPLALFGLVLAMMSALKVGDAIPNVIALSTLCTVLTALLIPLSVIGALVYATQGIILLGIGALLAMAIPLVAFVAIIAWMSGIENGIANAMVLTTLMAVLGGVLYQLSLVAPLAMVAVGALGALVGLMTAIGAFAVIVGALVTEFPQLQTFLDVGIPILVQMAAGLGQMIGSFISALAGEIMSILPQLGLCLSQFMINATPFITGAKMIDEKVLAGVGILAGAILALVAADLIAGVVSFLQGGSSFADLGTQLSQFMTNAMPFIMGASTITPEMMAGVKALADTILIITAANVLEGLTSFITGGSSLETFAEQLPILGQGLSAFSTSLGSFTPEQLATVTCAAQAVKMLASAAAEIPNTGGLLASIIGENDLSTFAAQFPILGFGLAQFLSNVGTFTEEQVATVDCAANAIKSLASAAAEIPNTGGLIASIVGENDLGTFAAQFPVLGIGLRGFLDNVGTFSEDQVATVDCAAKAIKSLASAAAEIPNSGGWVGAIVGENDLGTFAEQFPALGTGLAGFLTNVGTFSEDQIATVDCAAKAVATLASTASTIPNSGGWLGALVGDNDFGTFAAQFPKIGTGLAGFVKNIGTFSEEKVTTVNTAVKAIKELGNLANADLTKLPKFGDDLPDLGKGIATFCKSMPSSDSLKSAVSGLKDLVSAVKSIASTNSGPLKTFADNLKKIGKDAVKKFVEAFTSDSSKTDIKEAAKKLGDKASEGLKEKKKDCKTAGEDVAKQAVKGLKTQKDEAETAGKDLGAGYIKGINAKKTAAYDAGYALGEQGAKGIKKGQKSNSPSKLAIQSGKWLGEGYVIGIGKMGNLADKAGNNLGKTATNSLSNSIAKISNMIGNDIDSQPTIRPVLDLSDVESGTAALGSMLNMDSSVGVRANVGAISSMMSLRGQNRGNGDVVTAIDKLSKKMDGMGNTTYHIDGIAYDDGTEVASAIQTLVRAARIEGRT